MLIRALMITFWVAAVVTAGWVAVSSWNYDLVGGLFGETGSQAATLTDSLADPDQGHRRLTGWRFSGGPPGCWGGLRAGQS